MQTEEKTSPITTQPEIYASAGRYYIMNRRSENADKHATDNTEAPQEKTPDVCRRIRSRHREISSAVHLVSGAAGIIAGAATALLHPFEGMIISASDSSFFTLLSDRLIQCGIFLLAEYILGYFAAGGVIVWMLPMLYGLGAGLSAVSCVTSGTPIIAVLHILYTTVICFAAAHSAGFSSLLLSIVSGKSGSVITDGTSGRSYDHKFLLYVVLTAAGAIAEAIILTI